MKRIGIIAGDGIGKEVVPAARRVLDAVSAPFTFVPLEAGWECFERTGTALPQATQSMLRGCDASRDRCLSGFGALVVHAYLGRLAGAWAHNPHRPSLDQPRCGRADSGLRHLCNCGDAENLSEARFLPVKQPPHPHCR